MRRVLLDHCVPRRVRLALTDCEVATAFERGWNELKNGALLSAAEQSGFDIFITADKNIRSQQNLANRRIAILVLPTNTLDHLLPLFSAIDGAVRRLQPGAYEELPSQES